MPDISIKVRNKIATAAGDQTVVCGNDDYTVTFDLDAEWGEYDIKTMRVNWLDTFSGQPRHADVVFSGTRASLPAITDAYEVGIGLYAGNIRATTAARIPCTRCVTDGGTYHDDPPPDEYAQLLALLQRMTEAGFGRVGDSTPIIDGYNLSMVGVPEFPDITTIDLLQEPYLSTVQSGSLSDETGQPQSNAARATCYSYIDIPDERSRIKVDIAISETAGQYFIDLYDEDESYLYSATSSTDPLTGVSHYSFTDSGTLRSVHPDAKMIRVGVRKASNSNFSVSSITEFKITFM